MLERSALIGFVGVSDLDRARQFYGDTLGLPITQESPFALVADANGTMLRLTPWSSRWPLPTRSWAGTLRTSRQ